MRVSIPFCLWVLSPYVRGINTARKCSDVYSCQNPTSRDGSSALLPLAFAPLPLGSIKPLGWLQDQLQLMADGLPGHERDFYLYVKLSSWLGSDREYSNANEGFPYWFNGLVPLAYALDDDRLKEQVHRSVEYVLDHQSTEGWLGPEGPDMRNFWARYPFCLGLIQLAEANSTWFDPVVHALQRFTYLMHAMLSDDLRGLVWHPGDKFPFIDTVWGRARTADMTIVLQWLYENAPQVSKQVLLENMQMLQDGSSNWFSWYTEEKYIKEDFSTLPDEKTSPYYFLAHGVNVGQGLKTAAVVRRFTHNDSLLDITTNAVTWTFQYHGAASGTVLADERLQGLSPHSGSELCTAVEVMYSMSYLFQALGANEYADRAELAAFNALPVMITPDWWAHQYVAQPNQPWSTNLASRPFDNVNDLGQTYGLEPNFPCCTVNHPQGYPKFLSGSFVQVGTNGLAHILLSPAHVSTTLASGSVSIRCDTNYPFGSKLKYTVSSEGSFDFHIRIPEWTVSSASYVVIADGDGEVHINLAPDQSSGIHRVQVAGGDLTATVYLESSVVMEPRANDTVAVRKGALLYALDVGASVSSIPPRNYQTKTKFRAGYAPRPSRDWEMINTKPWNVAIDPSTLVFHSNGADDVQLANPIFAPGAPPSYFTVKACEIDWALEGSVPGHPPKLAKRKCLKAAFEGILVPYGSAKLHMAELPTIDLSSTISDL